MVAGEPAKVSELRQQWSDTTVGENPREFARFVIRRAILAIERVELRLLGPEYKSPRLVKPEMLESARFREGLEKIPGATVDKAGEMLDELATGWSRFSVDLIPASGRAIFSRGFDPNIDYDLAEVESMRHALETHPAVLLFSHRSYLDGVIVPVAMRENRLPPVYTFAGINLSFGFMGPLMRRSGVIFIRRKIDDPLYKYVLKEFVGYIVEKRFNLTWSIEAPGPAPERCCRPSSACSATSPTRTWKAAPTTFCCSRCRSASISSMKPPSTPHTPAAGRRRRRA